MKGVLVTGAKGFLGKNLITKLEENKNINIYQFDKENNLDEIKEYIDDVNFVYHLAGVNRSKNEIDFFKGNRDLTKGLVEILMESGKKIPLLMTSSIQVQKDNPYGKSKRLAEQYVVDYREKTHSPVYIYRLPNVFGKWCRPYYNSVVATWCYNISHNKPIEINNPDTLLTLVHIDDVIDEFISVMGKSTKVGCDDFYTIKNIYTLTLKELADKIMVFKKLRETLVIPNLINDFDKALYGTYLSYLKSDNFNYNLDMKCDHRGYLAEFIKSKEFGQIFISKTKPGVTRGNHWHHKKVEKFLVIEGEATIRLRNIKKKEIIEYKVCGTKLQVVDIPVGYTHSITNIGNKELITLFWASEIFDNNRPDTYYLEV